MRADAASTYSKTNQGTPAAPVNDLPNPYRTITGGARLPEGRTWGSTSAVAIDRDGVSIWVGERCGQNSCAGSDLDPILKFDSTGALAASFGKGMLLSPHGITVDREGNVWLTDCACTGSAHIEASSHMPANRFIRTTDARSSTAECGMAAKTKK